MTTYERSTLPGFETEESTGSTRSAAGSRARTSRWLARVRVLTESEVAYGESTRVWLASFDRATSSWRTSELFGLEDSPKFSDTLPRSGMTLNGNLYLLPPLVRLIYATGCGSSPLMPTPTVSGNYNRRGASKSSGDGLITHLKRSRLLPTPVARDGRKASDYSDGSRGHSPRLCDLGNGRLNPRFVESMMRIPQDWTSID